jgi:hypothetical protein
MSADKKQSDVFGKVRSEIVAHLTKAVVEAAKAPTRGQGFIRDDSIKGFALRVKASGARSFIWEGRVNGRVRRITIGQFPDMPVAVALDRALGIRAAVAQGSDPYTSGGQRRLAAALP